MGTGCPARVVRPPASLIGCSEGRARPRSVIAEMAFGCGRCKWLCLALMTVVFVQHVVVATVQWWTYHMENEALLSKVLLPFDARVADSHARARAYYEEQRPYFEDAARRFHLHQHFVETARNFSAKDTTYYDRSEKRLRAMAQLLRSNGRDDFLIEKSKRAPHVAHGGPHFAGGGCPAPAGAARHGAAAQPPRAATPSAILAAAAAAPIVARTRTPVAGGLGAAPDRTEPRFGPGRAALSAAPLPLPPPPDVAARRCVMSSFFQRNGLAMVPILRNWTDRHPSCG